MESIEKPKKIPKWLPNWKDEDAYPNPKNNISREQWAWEFMRRNLTYQKLFREGLKHNKSWYQKHSTDSRFSRYFICKPRANKNESYDDYVVRCQQLNKTPVINSKKRRILKEFPIKESNRKFNPANSEPPEFNTDYNYPFMFVAPDYDEEFIYNIKDDDEVFMVFLSALSIEDQIKKATELLEEDRLLFKKEGNPVSEKMKIHQKSFRNYLRILDGVLSGATQTEIANVLYPGQGTTAADNSALDKVNKGLKTAIGFRDGGYLKILETVILS